MAHKRILKVNLSLELNLNEILPVNDRFICCLPQINLTKIKLEYLKFGFLCKKERYEHRRKIFASFEFHFFRGQLEFAFRIRPNFYN